MSSPQPTILEIAQAAVHGRGLEHGPIGTIARNINLFWDALDRTVAESPNGQLLKDSGLLVPLRLQCLKLVRFCHQPRNRDHAADGAGYWELADHTLSTYRAAQAPKAAVEERGECPIKDFAVVLPIKHDPAGPTLEEVFRHEAARAAHQPAPTTTGALPLTSEALSQQIVDASMEFNVGHEESHLEDGTLVERVRALQALQGVEGSLAGSLTELEKRVSPAVKPARDAVDAFRIRVHRLARRTAHAVTACQFTAPEMREAFQSLPPSFQGELMAGLRDFFSFPFPDRTETPLQAQEEAAIEETRIEAVTTPQIILDGPTETWTSASEAQHQEILAADRAAATQPERPPVKLPLKDVVVERNPQWQPTMQFATQNPIVSMGSREWMATLKAPMQGIPVVGYGGTPVKALKDLQRAIQATQEFIEQSGEVEAAPAVPAGLYGPSTIYRDPNPLVQPLSFPTMIGLGLMPSGIPNAADMLPTTVSLAGLSTVSGTADHASEGGTP